MQPCMCTKLKIITDGHCGIMRSKFLIDRNDFKHNSDGASQRALLVMDQNRFALLNEAFRAT